MADPLATAFVRVRPDTKGFGRDAERGLIGPLGDVGKRAGKALAVGIGAAIAGAGVFAGKAISAASDLSEVQSKVNVVFGKSATQIQKFGDTAATALGQSRVQALGAAADFGNLLTALKLPQDAAADMSQKMVTLAGDLASFNNVNPEEALLALRSGLTGETEPLKRFGVNLNDATLKQKALDLGLTKTTKGTLPPAIKAQAAYALIMEQTATAQGDFARTSGGLANQQRILKARFADLSAQIGAKLLPVAVALAGFLNNRLFPAIGNVAKRFDGFFAGLKGNGPVAGFTGALNTLGLGLRATVLAFKDGDVTSNGFVGAMERVGVAVRNVVGFIRGTLIPGMAAAFAAFRNPDAAAGVGFFAQVGLAARKLFDYIKNVVVPIVMDFATRTIATVRAGLETLRAKIEENRPQFEALMQKLGELANLIITKVVPVLISLYQQYLQQVFAALGTLIGIIGGVVTALSTLNSWFDATVAAVARFVAGAIAMFHTFKAAVGAAITAAIAFVATLPGRAVAALASLGGLLAGIGASAMAALKGAIGAGIGAVQQQVAEIPGRVVRAMGNVGSLLYDAGARLLSGFIDGIKSKIGAVKDTLGGVTNKLTSWKGPPSLDRRILAPSGRMVIQGFQSGIAQQVPALRRQLQGVTGSLAPATSATLDATVRPAAATPTLPAAPTGAGSDSSSGVTAALLAEVRGLRADTQALATQFAAEMNGLGGHRARQVRGQVAGAR